MSAFEETDETEICELLMGRSVIKVEKFDTSIDIPGAYSKAEGKLTLDDGREVFVAPNIGGCSCGAGDYYLDSLERVDNIITRVELERTDVEATKENDWEGSTTYRIFVLAGHERINLLSIHGDDGNGYYGTGYELVVADPPGA